MSNSKMIDLLNGYVLHQWVCDYQMCSYYIEEMKNVINDFQVNTKNEFKIDINSEYSHESEEIVDKITLTEIDKAIHNFESFKQDAIFLRENEDIFLSTSNDLLSAIVFKNNPVSYSIRAVIKKFENWNEPVLCPEKGVVLNSDSIDSTLEYVYDIEQREFFGNILFTSLGIVEGEIYENEGSKELDRREGIIKLVKRLSERIYL
ncbi:hypothetical protein [Planococcus rifietoensis]|uniref:hypothetical protein n=1 Tax=Planococcus rifietoensis TaxID=200991 RepID=UPI00384DE5A0